MVFSLIMNWKHNTFYSTFDNYALVNFKPHSPTPGCPHTPDRDLKLTLVPSPGAVDIEAEVFRIFVAVAFKGIESHLRLFDVTIAIYTVYS